MIVELFYHRRSTDHLFIKTLLMNVPPALSWTELQDLAADRDGWRKRVHSLRHGSTATDGAPIGVSITINPSLPGCKVTRSRPLPPALAPAASP